MCVCLCVCVYVCVGGGGGAVCMCVSVYMLVCVCVSNLIYNNNIIDKIPRFMSKLCQNESTKLLIL